MTLEIIQYIESDVFKNRVLIRLSFHTLVRVFCCLILCVFHILILVFYVFKCAKGHLSAVCFSRSRDMVGAHQNLNGLRDLNMPLSGMSCHPWAENCCDQLAYQI